MEKQVDFEIVIPQLSAMTNRAKATFFKRMIDNLGPSLCKTIIAYACQRLDAVNSKLPEDSPYRQQYEARRRKRIPV